VAVLFYDGECPACRAFARLVLVADTRRRIRTATLDSEEADRLLGSLPEDARSGSYHLVEEDGRISSGRDGVGRLLELLPPVAPVGRLIHRSPTAHRAAAAAYDVLARNRGRLGRVLRRAGPPRR
jgi:predicted DCC family thiol-disulfide oxidoreductase YuxK